MLVVHMVSDAVRCLNQFPWENGISETMSPASLVTGVGNPDYHHMRVELGAYVQVFEDNTPSNTLKSRSVGAIALTPTGNAQGDYYFMSLATGKRLSRHNWTPLPITDSAIARVYALASAENQPLLQESGLVVEWRPDHPIDPTEYDRAYEIAPDGPDGFDADDYDAVDDDEVENLLGDMPYPFYDPLADAVAQGAFGNDDDGHNAEEDDEDDEDDGDYDDDNDDDNDNNDGDDYDNDDDAPPPLAGAEDGANNDNDDLGDDAGGQVFDDDAGDEQGAPMAPNAEDQGVPDI